MSNGYVPFFGWTPNPAEVQRITAMLPMPYFESAAPHLKGTGAGKDVLLWEVEQKVIGKLLPSQDQGQIGSCVSHGWSRGCQDRLLIQIATGAAERWAGEVAREPIYGGSRVQVGGDRSGEGSVGAWAAKWVHDWGVVLYGSEGLDGYYSVDRCRDWGRNGVPENYQQMAKAHPARTVSVVTTPEGVIDLIGNWYSVAICGQTSRDMKRQPGGWCPKTGNNWPHCECIRGICIVAGGSSSPWGGDGAFPFAGDVQAWVEQNSWADYLGSLNADVRLASGKTFTLPEGCYLSKPEERAADLREGDTFGIGETLGWEARDFSWLI